MRARDIMTTPVITIDVDARVIDAAERLATNQIDSMPVLDPDGRLIGMISELDIIRGRLAHDPRSHLRREHHDMDDPATAVRSIMTPTAICLTEFADVADIAETMLDHGIRAIPIVDGPHVVGIVSRRDLLRSLVRSAETIAGDINSRLEGQPGVPEDCAVSVTDGIVTIVATFQTTSERELVDALARTVSGVQRVHVVPRIQAKNPR